MKIMEGVVLDSLLASPSPFGVSGSPDDRVGMNILKVLQSQHHHLAVMRTLPYSYSGTMSW